MMKSNLINLGVLEIKDIHQINSFLFNNKKNIKKVITSKIYQLTGETAEIDVLELQIIQFNMGTYNLVMNYSPKYIFSNLSDKDFLNLCLWIRKEVLREMKIFKETTQASAISNHPAKHVNLAKKVKKPRKDKKYER